jgi:hypothetical protein
MLELDLREAELAVKEAEAHLELTLAKLQSDTSADSGGSRGALLRQAEIQIEKARIGADRARLKIKALESSQRSSPRPTPARPR